MACEEDDDEDVSSPSPARGGGRFRSEPPVRSGSSLSDVRPRRSSSCDLTPTDYFQEADCVEPTSSTLAPFAAFSFTEAASVANADLPLDSSDKGPEKPTSVEKAQP